MKKKTIHFLFVFYKIFFSFPAFIFFGPACRFSPTCSKYAKESIIRFGFWKGGMLSIKRISSCHPFSKKDVLDPVPNLN